MMNSGGGTSTEVTRSSGIGRKLASVANAIADDGSLEGQSTAVARLQVQRGTREIRGENRGTRKQIENTGRRKEQRGTDRDLFHFIF